MRLKNQLCQMKQYLAFLKNISWTKIIVVSVLIRVILLPLWHHSDINNHAIWGIYANEFGFNGYYDWLNFGNYARPDYPPLAILIFWWIRKMWQFVFDILWWINIHISIFPSNVMTWFDQLGYQKMLKIPAVIGDIGMGYTIYWYFSKIGKKEIGKLAGVLFLFNPVVIYSSSVWGQLDSFVCWLGILALLFVLKKRYLYAAFFFWASIMTKQTMLPIFLILFLLSLKQRVSMTSIVKVAVFSGVILYVLGNIFTDSNPIVWLVGQYMNKFVKGAPLPYINLNAFNLWGLVLGLERTADSTLVLGLTVYWWLWLITGLMLFVVLLRFWKGGDVYVGAAVVFLTIFMFASRVHERYFYPGLVILPFILGRDSKYAVYFWGFSIVGFLNLYHWWWKPEVGLLMRFLEMEIVERGLSFANLILFLGIFSVYLKGNEKKIINNNS